MVERIKNNKIFTSIFYLLSHTLRAIYIIKLYRHLHGKYRLKITLVQAYREAIYLTKNSTKQSKPTSESKQTIICIHDGLTHTGGLTDRLKGICTLFNYAKKNGFIFKIYFVSPFRLEKYLIPNQYDWLLSENELSYDPEVTSIYTWEDEKFVTPFFNRNKDKQQFHIGCNSRECYPHYSALFNELFTLSPDLQNELQTHIEKLGNKGNYISISFRFQNLLGEFQEANSVSLSKEDQESLIEKCLVEISKIKELHGDISKILITSDSNVFREIAMAKYPYIYSYVFPEEVGHIDYADSGKSKERTAFLDMFLIANAKNVYQIRSKEMYNSDFPVMAAKITDSPYKMILIE